MIETELNSDTHRAERAELETVLASDLFRRAPTLARILEYLCERQLRGESFIKEYEIATQVMGRSSDFDPQQDGSVRVNLHHLRKKLRTFYETEGSNHDVWITLPIGQSLPSFILQVSETNSAEPHFAEEEGLAPGSVSSTAPAREDSAPTPGAAPAIAEEPAREIPKASNRARSVTILLLSIASAALLAFLVTWFSMRDRQTETPRPGITDATLRIGCGKKSAYQDGAGRVWSPDAYFAGGRSFHRQVAPISGTGDSGIYQNGRVGNFSYDIPLPRALYELHLYFAETALHGEGFRMMQIWVNGKRVEQYFDVTSDAGGFASATEKIYTSVQPAADGKVHLQFKGVTADAFVNAIEIMPGNGDSMRPIRQTALPTYYFDPQGTVWTPDMWFHGGRVNHIPDIFPDLPLQGFYQNERFGNFSYSIPVLPGRKYSLTLYFQDAWFSHQRQQTVNTGMRRFDVACNGKELLQQFDILREADGNGFHVVKHFSGIEPTTQGKILLTFTPSQNYAMLNALTIEEEPPVQPPATAK